MKAVIYKSKNIIFFFMMGLLASLFVIGCATVPEPNPALERARSAYEQAQANPNIGKNAPVSLYEAAQALKKAEQAQDETELNHLAYIAERKAQIAVAQAEQKMAEEEKERLLEEKNKIVLHAREIEANRAIRLAERRAEEAERARKETEAKAMELERAKGEAIALAQQADKARKEAETRALEIQQAKGETEAKALEAEKSKKEAEAKALEAEKSKKEAEARKLEADLARVKAEEAKKEAEMRKREAELARVKAEKAVKQREKIESELEQLKAKKTDRGLILTLGDILFETGKAILMSGATRTLDKLAEFLEQYPNRKVLIEGFTDSTGSDTYNLGLSQKRADSVRDALTMKGVAAARITTKGYGEQYPIASNATSAGKQQNRRVEVVILDEGVGPEKMLR